MSRVQAAVGSAVFFVLAPGTILGYLPWLLTGWQVRDPLPVWLPFRFLGVLLLLAGVGAIVHSFIRFVVEGLGTPAPVAAPRHLVVGGLYSHVRNPIYVSLLVAITGEALLLGHLSLLVYAGAVGLFLILWVLIFEEPALREQFGEEYETYRRAVPGWWPRVRPWKAG
jgi:protein-S-isoprenylcysteine O-methyltransferase Ste14